MRVWVLLALLVVLPGVSAYQVAETDFSGGAVFRTVFSAGNLTLALSAPGMYHTSGNYSSVILSAGALVRWTNISWTAINTTGEVVMIQARTGNTSLPDDSWSPFSPNMSVPQTLSGVSHYAQFMVLFESTGTTTPTLMEVNFSYDLIPLTVQLRSPAHNTVSSNPNITFTCSATSSFAVQNITLYTTIPGVWTPNTTVITNDTASFTFLGVPDGTYTWNCKAEDGTTNAFALQNNTVVIAASNAPPVISGTQITPAIAAPNTTILLGINATDADGIGMVWATITSPNNSVTTLPLVNNNIIGVTLTDIGTYLVSFFANDTLGIAVNVQRSLTIADIGNVSGSIQNPSGPLTANVTIIQAGTVVSQEQSAFFLPILQAPFDIAFSVYSGDFQVRINSVPAAESNKTIRIDSTAADGYPLVYAIINPYSFSNGEVTIRYPDTLFASDAVNLFICANWNFAARSCTGSYTQASTFTVDPTTNTIRFNVTSFSGFALQQQGFCGDGTCSAGENQTSCSADCECLDGQTRSCGSVSVGECSSGIQTCASGEWGTCIGGIPPSTEICNRKDDDCNGITDDVNGGTLLEETQCRCFIGAPTQEVCNNIDDDCDGQVDGFSKACGSNIGVCKEGSQICTRGVFGTCSGGISPTSEICDNNIDDNCDADIDEDCPLCTDGIQNGIEEGVDCGGMCANACVGLFSPLTILPIVAILALIAGVYYFKFRRSSWSKLEKKYSYTPK